MDVQEKIKKAEKLGEVISRMESFIKLAHKAQEIDEVNKKNNELKGINRFVGCTISAYISTGSQSPQYKETIIDDNVIVSLMTGGLSCLEENLKTRKEELEKMFA
jgi:hypothetical protein